MKTHASGLHGNFDVRLEPDPYCPRVHIRRPAKLKLSQTILDPATGMTHEKILGNEEGFFIEDVFFELAHRDDLSAQEKLHTINQIRNLLNKLERMVNEKIEEVEWGQNNPYVDDEPA